MPDSRFFKPKQGINLKELAQITNSQLLSKTGDLVINNVASLEKGKNDEIAFFDNKKMLDVFQKSNAGACFVKTDFNFENPQNICLLASDNPHEAFVKTANYFYPLVLEKNISSQAVIHQTAKIGQNCNIEAGVVIDDGVEIGDNCFIGANTVIRSNVIIGEGSRIYDNVTISYAVVGKRAIIYSGVRIGQDGFGYLMGAKGHTKIPQLGRVIIGDDVDIGANTTIDRGAIDDTVIGSGSKIDNLVQIAHNVKLGFGCVLAAQVGISGSTKLGNLVAVGGQAGFADHLTIGDGARIAAQSGIMRDVNAGETVMGSPAFPMKEYMRHIAYLQKASHYKK